MYEEVKCWDRRDDGTDKVEPCLPTKLLLTDQLHDLVVNQVEAHVAHEDEEEIVGGITLGV